MRQLTFSQALDEAVAEEMRRDPRVITWPRTSPAIRSRNRSQARSLHADFRIGAYRHGPGSGRSGYRPIVNWAHGHLLFRRHGSDRQPWEKDSLHVRWSGGFPGRPIAAPPAAAWGLPRSTRKAPIPCGCTSRDSRSSAGDTGHAKGLLKSAIRE